MWSCESEECKSGPVAGAESLKGCWGCLRDFKIQDFSLTVVVSSFMSTFSARRIAEVEV